VLLVLTCSLNTFQKLVLYVFYFKTKYTLSIEFVPAQIRRNSTSSNSTSQAGLKITLHVTTVSSNHRIKIHIEGPLTSEALKFLSSRMSHYACWPLSS
jgi:hypothetical protein